MHVNLIKRCKRFVRNILPPGPRFAQIIDREFGLAIAAAEFVETFPVPFVRDVISLQKIVPGFGRRIQVCGAELRLSADAATAIDNVHQQIQRGVVLHGFSSPRRVG